MAIASLFEQCTDSAAGLQISNSHEIIFCGHARTNPLASRGRQMHSVAQKITGGAGGGHMLKVKCSLFAIAVVACWTG
jgi:hypothetical protein